MVRTIIIIVAIVLLGYFVFNYRNANNTGEEQMENVNQSEVQMEGGNMMDDDQHGGDTYSGGQGEVVAYENKAMGYELMRPDKWYWQHYIKNQITSEGDIVDIFATDPFIAPLPSVPTNSRIAIEVYSKETAGFDEMVAGLESSQVQVDGTPASRYEGTIEGKKTIIYDLASGGKTYHIIYSKSGSSPEEEGVFENLVSSLQFN